MWGALRGFRSVGGSGWWALKVPVALWGWLVLELSASRNTRRRRSLPAGRVPKWVPNSSDRPLPDNVRVSEVDAFAQLAGNRIRIYDLRVMS